MDAKKGEKFKPAGGVEDDHRRKDNGTRREKRVQNLQRRPGDSLELCFFRLQVRPDFSILK